MGRPAFKGMAAGDKQRAGSAGTFVMEAYRKDLVDAADHFEPLHRVVAGKGSPMTPVRLLEVAVWMANEPKRYYRRRASAPISED
jgi:hypothetical protein